MDFLHYAFRSGSPSSNNHVLTAKKIQQICCISQLNADHKTSVSTWGQATSCTSCPNPKIQFWNQLWQVLVPQGTLLRFNSIYTSTNFLLPADRTKPRAEVINLSKNLLHSRSYPIWTLNHINQRFHLSSRVLTGCFSGEWSHLIYIDVKYLEPPPLEAYLIYKILPQFRIITFSFALELRALELIHTLTFFLYPKDSKRLEIRLHISGHKWPGKHAPVQVCNQVAK